jgi:hypothetical protein
MDNPEKRKAKRHMSDLHSPLFSDMLSNMGSLFDAPADAIALQQLFESTQDQRPRFRLGHLFGARALKQPGGYWLDHVRAVRVMAHEMRHLVADGYRVIPQLKVPGTQDELLDFLVISPRGSVYAIVAHDFGSHRVRLDRKSVLVAGRTYAYPGDLRVKADEVSLRLRQRDYPHAEVIPMLVAVNATHLTNRGGRVRGATDYTFIRQIRRREEQRMRQGFDVLRQDERVHAPEFWQDTREFDATGYQRNTWFYRRWRLLTRVADWSSVFWSQIAFGLLAGGMLGLMYYLSVISASGPMIIVPGH